MKVKSVNFSQLSDIMGFTILLKKTDDCYNVLGLLHQKYSYVPGRFKDYISTPKPNGYQSLHTTLIGPVNRRIEIQVRTFKMNDQADLGVAAHWIYKEKVDKNEGKQYKGTIKYPSIPLSFEDIYVYSTQGDRFDILAQQYYSDSSLWWVISSANGELKQDSYYIPEGTQIRIPQNISEVVSKFKNLNER